MHVDDSALSWVTEIEKSFQPYLEFVEHVCTQLETITSEKLAAPEAVTIEPDPTLEALIAAHDESFRIMTSEKDELQASLSLTQSSLSLAEANLAQTQARELAALDARAALEVLLHAETKKYEDLLASISTQRIEQEGALAAPTKKESHPKSELENRSAPALPPKSEQEPIESERILPVEIARAQKRVLLIDDAEINRVLMSHYLKGLPVKLDFAITAEMAFQKCQQFSFDLIVIDADLKEPDGASIAAELKSRGSVARMAALSNAQAEVLSPQIGFEMVLRRGLSRDQFTEQLKSLLWN